MQHNHYLSIVMFTMFPYEMHVHIACHLLDLRQHGFQNKIKHLRLSFVLFNKPNNIIGCMGAYRFMGNIQGV